MTPQSIPTPERKQRRRLSAGQSAPAFALPDAATGETVSLADFAGSDALVVFLRGTWCPYCHDQLTALRENHERLTAAGVRVVAVACQGRGALGRYLKRHPLPFPLLADERREAAKVYGTHYWLSPEGINLSHPALFVLDRQQSVTFAHVGRNMRDLPVGLLLERFLSFLAA